MPHENGSFDFEREVLPRLLAAYETGRLTPFVGVGMSRPNCADWPKLIASLESVVLGKPSTLDADTKPEALIQHANRAVLTLRARGEGEFETALRAGLFNKSTTLPAQMTALASIWWPLVLTTNYDDLYVEAFSRDFGANAIAVVGRSSEDCQRVLTSLTTAGRTLLWALQGHLSSRSDTDAFRSERRLAKELVIDHAEYRRVTNREPHFRRAFAEVFRHRSLFFLGSGLRENYLQELFGEVLELYGSSSRTHYAIMPKGDVDPRFMYSRFQVAVVEYDTGKKKNDHSAVPECLARLRGAIEQAQSAPVSWSWGNAQTTYEVASSSHAHLEVVRGPLPTKHVAGECLALSAGGRIDADAFHISATMKPTRIHWCRGRDVRPTKLSPFVGEYAGYDAFAVRARRAGRDEKDLLAIRAASCALFDIAAERGYSCVRMQLLATGGSDDAPADQPRWSARTFPARFAFVEMVRAWGEWRRAHDAHDMRLALHVVDPSVSREIASGRIDVLELLACADVRFWAEIVEGDVMLERRSFHEHESTTLRAIVDELCLDVKHWTFEVSPPTDLESAVGQVRLDAQDSAAKPYVSRSLREIGVVPGSTLHFRRKQP